MFCTQCGTQIPDGGIVCPNCGKPVGGNKNINNNVNNNVTRGPVNDPYANYNPYAGMGQQPMVDEAGKPFAIASLVLGIVSIVLVFTPASFIGLILSIIGLVMASMAKSRGFEGGLRTAGFVLSLIALIICAVAVIAVLACYGTVGSILNSAARYY